MKTKRIGYIVKYSSGQYEDYREYTVGVYMNKEDAENRCKEIDEQHLNPQKPEWDQDDWFDIDEAYYYEFSHPTSIAERYPRLMDDKKWDDFETKEEYHEYLDNKYADQDRMLEDVVMKFFPTWTREKAREQINIQEWLDSVNREDYNRSYVEEITIYE